MRPRRRRLDLLAALAAVATMAAAAGCPAPRACATSSDCRGGRICAHGTCAVACNDPSSCAPGEGCIDGACLPPFDVDDAGEARTDGGLVDAGGGGDAGQADAGREDAGPAVCGPGQRDGGDGRCVPEGSCSPGYAEAFFDEDGDGRGGLPTQACVPSALQPGYAASGGDCDDADGAIWSLGVFYPDEDGDTFTVAPVERCAGDAPPEGTRASPRPPPVLSLVSMTAASLSVPSFSEERWANETQARLRSALSARVDGVDPGKPSELLVVTDHGLALPPGATLLGLEVHVFRRATQGRARDATVRLVKGGQPIGEDRGDEATEWPTAMTQATYGGPTDLWGAALTAEDLADPTFGAAVSVVPVDGTTVPVEAEVDFVGIAAWIDLGIDCDDADPARFFSREAWSDVDDDEWGSEPAPAMCLGEALLPDGVTDRPGDCYDGNGAARPRQPAFFSASRGDGSFDYDCDGAEQRRSLSRVTACTLDASTGACTSTTQGIAEAPCGQANQVGACDANCALVDATQPTQCR